MTPPNSSGHDDREALSALFDGELEADAARFAHRRLGHDPQWRDACGRWQLAGDVLRRHAGRLSAGAAPAGFADPGFAEPGFAERVAQALEAESRQAGQIAVANAPRRRWIPGAALAASVAVAALFVVRPLSEPEPGPGLAPAPLMASDAESGSAGTSPVDAPATALAQSEDMAPAASPSASESSTFEPAAAEAVMAAAATAVAAAETSRRSDRAPRSLGQRRTSRSNEAASMTVAAETPAVTGPVIESVPVDAIASLPGSTTTPSGATPSNPFAPAATETDADATPSRPWPRAVLPGYGERGGYAVGFGEAVQASPSFFPFEPQLSGQQEAVAAEEPSPPPER